MSAHRRVYGCMNSGKNTLYFWEVLNLDHSYYGLVTLHRRTLKPVGWKEIYKYLDTSSIATDADPETLVFKTPINSKNTLSV